MLQADSIRRFVYRQLVDTGRAPSVVGLSAALSSEEGEIRALLAQLAREHVLVIDPTSSEIRMAMPFSAVPTTFRVQAEGKAYWAN